MTNLGQAYLLTREVGQLCRAVEEGYGPLISNESRRSAMLPAINTLTLWLRLTMEKLPLLFLTYSGCSNYHP